MLLVQEKRHLGRKPSAFSSNRPEFFCDSSGRSDSGDQVWTFYFLQHTCVGVLLPETLPNAAQRATEMTRIKEKKD